MKITFKIKNYIKQNTPSKAQLVGDISLGLTFVAGLPLMCTQAGIIAIPLLIIKGAKVAAVLGATIKFFSKFLGVEAKTE